MLVYIAKRKKAYSGTSFIMLLIIISQMSSVMVFQQTPHLLVFTNSYFCFQMLKLSDRGWQGTTTGSIINLLASDVEKLQFASLFSIFRDHLTRKK